MEEEQDGGPPKQNDAHKRVAMHENCNRNPKKPRVGEKTKGTQDGPETQGAPRTLARLGHLQEEPLQQEFRDIIQMPKSTTGWQR